MMPEQRPDLDPDNLPPGTAVCGGEFVIEACLGRGGVATVYRVLATDGRRLALKLMVTKRAADGDQRERFDNEWRILDALRDRPYVVAVDRSGRHDDGRPWFTMDLVEAPTLADLIIDRNVSVSRACWVVREVANALDDLHRRGVIHRDIKPDNIMVMPQSVRVVDFGYAYAPGSDQVPRLAGLTSAEHRPGTHLYMAPEQAIGEAPAPSFDLYALAVTLYEALVGHAPNSELPLALMMGDKCGAGAAELSIEGRMFGLHEGLVQLVDHGLRRQPEERVASAAEFRDRLDAVLAAIGDEDAPAGVPESPVRLASSTESEVQPPREVTTERTPREVTTERTPRKETTERTPREEPLRPAIGGGRGETRPVRGAVAEGTRPIAEAEIAGVVTREAIEAAAAHSGSSFAALQAKQAAAAEVARRVREATTLGAGQSMASASMSGSTRRVWSSTPVLAAIGAGVLIVLLAVVWRVTRDPQPSVAAEPDVAPVTKAAVAEPEVGPAPKPVPEPEPEPKPEVVPEPEPEVVPEEPEVEPEEPEVTPDPGHKPPRTKPPRTKPEEPPCEDPTAETNAASRSKKWSRVLQLTKSPRCWDDPATRNALRVEALSELGRYKECAAVGSSSKDPEVSRMAKSCAAQLDKDDSP